MLELDEHTLKDLEIFEPATEGESLFDFCNKTRTEGGADVLRERMAHPWADAESIRATQQSVSFIQSERDAFSKLPSAFVSGRVGHYLHDILPIIVEKNPIEFTLGVLSMWMNHARYYSAISLGVQMTSNMLQSLRQFLEQPVLDQAVGELVPILSEIRELLAIPEINAIPVYKVGGKPWKTLRFDQSLRLYEKDSLRRLLALASELDALISMSDVSAEHDFVLPELHQGALEVAAEGLFHPFVTNPVCNSVDLNQTKRVLFLTGPNMAGKTTYLRAFATALYLGHLGMGVPASSFSFLPAQRLFTSISLSDDLRGGISYFRAEALRVKAIAKAIASGDRVVALMDEPFKGTNVKDALDASLAILERFMTRQDCLFMFSSHLIELAEAISSAENIDCWNFEADESGGKLKFDYTLRPGVSAQRLGMRVLEEEGVFELLGKAGEGVEKVEKAERGEH